MGKNKKVLRGSKSKKSFLGVKTTPSFGTFIKKPTTLLGILAIIAVGMYFLRSSLAVSWETFLPKLSVQSSPAPSVQNLPTKAPASIVDLKPWKLNLPTGPKTSASEVTQPQLATFSVNPWFMTNAEGNAVVFRAPVACTSSKTGPACGSRTSTNTKYARSELREMTNNGSTNASWDVNQGTHTFEVRLAFKKLPSVKPQLVGVQIHGVSDDVTVIRLESQNLWITRGDDSHYKLITGSYSLGTPITIKYVVSGGKVRVYYNGSLQATISVSGSGNYFKTGAYTQANCDNSSPCDGNINYGETHIYSAKVTHS